MNERMLCTNDNAIPQPKNIKYPVMRFLKKIIKLRSDKRRFFGKLLCQMSLKKLIII